MLATRATTRNQRVSHVIANLQVIRTTFVMHAMVAIKPYDVREYLDKRGQAAKTRANREKALLSHVFNKAREWG